MSQKEINRLSRSIVKILRHQAMSLNLKMTTDGYVSLNQLYSVLKKQNVKSELLNLDIIKKIVDTDNKQRLDLINRDQIWLLRANQGHSINVNPESLLTPIIKPLPKCIHGTYWKFLDSIKKNGLSKKSRDQIHFTTELAGQTKVISGMRQSVQVAIFINMKKAMNAGIKFYLSKNGVILSPGVDGIIESKFFEKIISISNI